MQRAEVVLSAIRKRGTIVVCRVCHNDIHKGRSSGAIPEEHRRAG
jgi:hypothetical protein